MKKTIKAFIFDLDGVLTETQELHRRAWGELFNEFLQERRVTSHDEGELLHNFESKVDYREFLDGKTREEGIKSFLNSRKIVFDVNDVRRLASKKNQLYLKAIEREGPHLIDESLSFIQKLKEGHIPMAVVSSSRNCREILKQAGITDYFDVIIEPHIANKKRLKGKPYPDYFTEAARQLGVSPQESAVVEDSLAGIESGRKGHFYKVYGVSLDNDQSGIDRLKQAGPDQVVSSLWQINEAQDYLKLPNALEEFDQIFFPGEKKNYFLFLDFDGTLAPIVTNPEQALPLPGISQLVELLTKSFPVSIITGRDLEVIKKKINLPHVYYAACHGFEISGPNGYHYELKEAKALIPVFDQAQLELTQALPGIDGLVIERKKFGLAFHYRMIKSAEKILTIKNIIKDYCLEHSSLRYQQGEEVIELQPRLDWDKGKALLHLYQVLGLDTQKYPPLYLGDGNTDEDAFREMRDWGVSILASEQQRPTLARFHLKGPAEIKTFLERVVAHV